MSAGKLRDHLRVAMRQTYENLGDFHDLTNAVEPVTPWRKSFKVIEHPFSREFTVFQAPSEVAQAFACPERSDAKLTAALDHPNPAYGDDYGAMFRFRLKEGHGAVIAMHWVKVSGHRKIAGWKFYEH